MLACRHMQMFEETLYVLCVCVCTAEFLPTVQHSWSPGRNQRSILFYLTFVTHWRFFYCALLTFYTYSQEGAESFIAFT